MKLISYLEKLKEEFGYDFIDKNENHIILQIDYRDIQTGKLDYFVDFYLKNNTYLYHLYVTITDKDNKTITITLRKMDMYNYKDIKIHLLDIYAIYKEYNEQDDFSTIASLTTAGYHSGQITPPVSLDRYFR